LSLKFGVKGNEDSQLHSPQGILVYDGKAYIADYDNSCISVFQVNGQFHNNSGKRVFRTPYSIKMVCLSLTLANVLFYFFGWSIAIWESLAAQQT